MCPVSGAVGPADWQLLCQETHLQGGGVGDGAGLPHDEGSGKCVGPLGCLQPP